MIAVLQLLADRLVRLTRRRRASDAERRLAAPDHAWTLVADPALWSLWMPAVGSLLEPARPLRRGLPLRVAVRTRPGRLGVGSAREGHVQVEELADGLLAWRFVAGPRIERYRLRREGELYRLHAEGGEDAARILAELDRETAPLD